MSGSKRIGGRLDLSLTSCSSEATVAFALGTRRATPIAFPTTIACGDVRSCLLSCNPAAIVLGPTASLLVENDPSLVGTSFCVQGMCFEPTCLRVTDLSTLTISQ